MEYTVTQLLQDGDGAVCGASATRASGAGSSSVQGARVVLAIGRHRAHLLGHVELWEGTADGQALAFEAGAELMDMEFVQFHPTGMVWPPERARHPRHRGGARRRRVLTNSNGERFMERYDPERMELSTRDVVARSIYTEVARGAARRTAASFLDISHKPADRQAEAAVDVHAVHGVRGRRHHKEPMEVYPTTHYMMGGIRVDAETRRRTSPGLYAAGECSRRDARRQSPRRQLALRPRRLRPPRRPRRARRMRW